MKPVVMFFMLSVAFALDCVLIARIALLGIKPSLTLCMVIAMGAVNGRFTGSMAGLLVGAMMDLMYGPQFGFYAIVWMTVGYIGSAVCKRYIADSILACGVVTAGAFAAKEVLMMVVTALMGVKNENVLVLFFRYLLPAALLTGLCALPFLHCFRWLFGKGFMKKRWRISAE